MVVGYLLGCAVITKSILGCPWRSVLTVFVMSSVVSNLVVLLAVLLVFSVDRIERLEQVLDQGVEAVAQQNGADGSANPRVSRRRVRFAAGEAFESLKFFRTGSDGPSAV